MKKIIKGFTLIEVLVALLILSISLLGGAALMIKNLKSENDELVETKFLESAESLVEKFKTLRLTNGFTIGYGDIPSNSNCFSSQCNPDQMLNFYIRNWKCDFGYYADTCDVPQENILFINGDGKIEYSNNIYKISYKWLHMSTNEEVNYEVEFKN